ncbi:hypothetical protein V492_01563 [Pseudogymnoascus sp. VKM F-4246]|nr:hypothetical protein V492_01563 [Pseudogymnoascus sp. VKM F-4246]
MSFGWSVGDLIAGLEVAIRIASALQDAGGAAEKYRQTTTYLLSLSTVLYQLHPPPPGLLAIAPDVQSVHSALQAFHSKLSAKFEKSLGRTPSDWVTRVRTSPRKVEYALFMEKQVEALRVKLDVPLKAINLALGIAIHKQGADNAEVSKETLGGIVDIKSALPGLEKAVLAGVEDIMVATAQRGKADRQYTAPPARDGGEFMPVDIPARGVHAVARWRAGGGPPAGVVDYGDPGVGEDEACDEGGGVA